MYKAPQILLHAARLKAWQTGVRPAVDLSKKALMYELVVKVVKLHSTLRTTIRHV